MTNRAIEATCRGPGPIGWPRRLACIWRAACALLPCLAAASAQASFTYYATVAMPMQNDGSGAYEVVHVTYLMSRTGYLPGLEVALTCDPGFVVLGAVGGEIVHENWNAANLEGMSVEVEGIRGRDGTPGTHQWTVADTSMAGIQRFVVDTLHVVLHVDSAYARVPREHADSWKRVLAASRDPHGQQDLERQERLRKESLEARLRFVDQLVDATITCILDNAARSKPRVVHVDVAVDGPERARRKSGVFTARRAKLETEP